ncbi:SpaH/EbpB family LPXTG-anchored major pilin [Corynebacterium diphtheriae]|uniref:SpaH/EbpB family LPXTG-anchored major pilin n=1 Tax=Corynebacterium diphtheriae TaxID=1717 RepID=UPI000246848B|nr:SpaH/EbpB family LPXTG-anchored major pilin [Corynebacterium diphtheriae]AEX72881.1 putative surface-anchored fimbrial subunit [Corynebacterium diphtheriae CDCE 8392]MCM0017319.1 SpaH/EbpB family LPXTG-anchored major pilin [Corynebacterium diphtheriae bv. mitis]MCM0027028.1 SpaH/EbpB family LPXTG-anchored major pilin [Corynebacterium diphtheriae bv. mitis]MCM0029710.1 SpaH/EbpB family LPXTG-anchored major pilin [Corynebacterium diphtheriae bv. mitis]MCM0037935.1 SpaH/EbpB family LPXTG-ancho
MTVRGCRLATLATALTLFVSNVTFTSVFAEESRYHAAQLGESPLSVDRLSIPERTSIAVHALMGLPTGQPANGTKIDSHNFPEVDGIPFTLYRVNNIDLTKQEGWDAASKIKLEELYVNGTPTGKVTKVTTKKTEGGVAKFDNLTPALYLVVQELNGTEAVVRSQPFLVAAPQTNPTGNGWLREVHVYPKHQALSAPVKTAVDPDTTQPGFSVGENVRYRVATKIPEIAANTKFEGFTVADKLPAELGEPDTNKIKVTLGGEPINSTDVSVQTYQVGDRTVLSVQLSGAALSTLDQHKNEELVVEFEAPVTKQPENGQLDNQAWVLPSNPTAHWDPEDGGDAALRGIASSRVSSKYGQITINKAFDGSTPSADRTATFQLHRCKEDGNLVESDAPISLNGKQEFVTDQDGKAVLSGIHLGTLQLESNVMKYTDAWAGKGTQFCLVETATARGYELLPKPVIVKLEANQSTNVLVKQEVKINNKKKNAGFELPLTGGSGPIAITIGIVGLLVALASYVVSRRKDNR